MFTEHVNIRLQPWKQGKGQQLMSRKRFILSKQNECTLDTCKNMNKSQKYSAERRQLLYLYLGGF